MAHNIAVIVGSLRKDAFSLKTAKALAKLAPSQLKLDVVTLESLSFFSQDLEANPPADWVAFREKLQKSDGVIIVTPEYNRSIPGVLKNALDHASRPYGQNAWAGKPAGVLGCSIGAISTAVAQLHLRTILAYLDMPTLGQPEVYLQVKDGFFDDAGNFANAETKKFLNGWMDKYVAWVKRLTS